MSTNNAEPTASAPEPSKVAVLYVDDEEQALKYFKKAYGSHFPVLTAPGVDQALAILEVEHERIGVLLTDQRMPGKTGVELLTRVRQTWPHIVRILVTAYSDIESAVAAVNAGAVYKYLTKPIDLVQTRLVLNEATANYLGQRARDTVVREKVGRLERMIAADRARSMSAVATGVSHHLRNSLTAISCFFEEISGQGGTGRPSIAAAAAGSAEESAYLDQLLVLANEERERLVKIVQDVEASGQRSKFQFNDQIELRALIERSIAAAVTATGAAEFAFDVPAGLPTIKGDAAAVERMLGILVTHAKRYSPPGTPVRVSAEGPVPYWNGTGVRIAVLGGGPAWREEDVASFFMPFSVNPKAPGDVGLELLHAFQTAMGHEGDVVAHRAAPSGPGFEVILPLDPLAVDRPAVVGGRLELTPVQ